MKSNNRKICARVRVRIEPAFVTRELKLKNWILHDPPEIINHTVTTTIIRNRK